MRWLVHYFRSLFCRHEFEDLGVPTRWWPEYFDKVFDALRSYKSNENELTSKTSVRGKRREASIIEQTMCCTHCGEPVTWDEINFTDGTTSKSLHWKCEKCGRQVFKIGIDLSPEAIK